MRRNHLWSVLASVVVACWLGVLARSEKRAEGPGVSAQLVPVVTLKSDDPELRFLFLNDSDVPLKYLDFHRTVGYLQFTLYRDGVVQKPEMFVTNIQGPDRVKVLGPGETKEVRLNLREIYGELTPGRYALDASMGSVPGQFGLSRVSFERRVLYVDVVRAE